MEIDSNNYEKLNVIWSGSSEKLQFLCVLFTFFKAQRQHQVFILLYILHSVKVKYDNAKWYIKKFKDNGTKTLWKFFGIILAAPLFGCGGDFIWRKDTNVIVSSYDMFQYMMERQFKQIKKLITDIYNYYQPKDTYFW